MQMDIERLAADELEKIDRHLSALEELRDDPTFVMLRDARLTGVTKRRWDAASAAVMSATSRLDKSRDTVAEAIRLLRANPPDAEQAERLLRGRSVPLTPAETPKQDRRPPASTSSKPRFSLRAVKDFVAEDLGTARRVVDEVAGALASARPRLGQLTAMLDDADSRLGPVAGSDTRDELVALRRDLDHLWGVLNVDPLTLGPAGASGPGSPDGLARLDAIDAGLALLSVRLASGGEPPSSAASRLARLRAAVGELAVRESQARARRAALVKRFTVADVPPALAAAAGLSARIDAAEARWQIDELDEIDRAVAVATQAASQVVQRADETFNEWDLLRGRLATYRLRAVRRGRATSQELAALHQHARQLLETAPCDLRRAAEAVRLYMSMERGDDPEPGIS
jgi:hypothetical protein